MNVRCSATCAFGALLVCAVTTAFSTTPSTTTPSTTTPSTTTPSTTTPSTTTQEAAADPGTSPTLGALPPRLDDGKTLVLCDGRWRGWHQRDGAQSAWRPQGDGSVVVHGGDAITDEEFGDFQLHLEFMCPTMPGTTGQARANSGVYLHGRYEVQVLGSFGDPPEPDNCGAIYSIAPPMVAASRPTGTYQTYDIVFRAPRYKADGTIERFAYVTVLHNGVVIHNNLELPHTTPGGLDREVARTGPILLQDHGDPIHYRNVWVRRLD